MADPYCPDQGLIQDWQHLYREPKILVLPPTRELFSKRNFSDTVVGTWMKTLSSPPALSCRWLPFVPRINSPERFLADRSDELHALDLLQGDVLVVMVTGQDRQDLLARTLLQLRMVGQREQAP